MRGTNFKSLLIGVVLACAFLALAGADKVTCVPTQPEEPLCVVSSDCEGLPHLNCLGKWACNEGDCIWSCDSEPVDEICGDGIDNDGDGLEDEGCSEIGDACDEDWECLPGLTCLGMVVVPNAPHECQQLCDEDGDCPEGYMCFIPGPGWGGGPTNYCVPWEPAGCKGDDDCPYGEFCQFPAGSCGKDGQYGECVDAPEACIDLWAPVCGCNGNTYSNDCYLEAAKQSKLHDGECDVVPGCMSNQECNLTEYCAFPAGVCAGPGECKWKPELCMDLWAPVCGCDGQTYSNNCYLAAAGVSFLHDGECDGTPDDCQQDGGFCSTIDPAGNYCPPESSAVYLAGCPEGQVCCMPDQACAKEGEYVAVYPGAPDCCPGLSSIPSMQFDPATGDCVTLVGAAICSNCGNGYCESGWENPCNCPQDCFGAGESPCEAEGGKCIDFMYEPEFVPYPYMCPGGMFEVPLACYGSWQTCCMSEGPTECSNNTDCPPGYYCEVYCGNGWCSGMCQPDGQPQECMATGCSGQICASEPVITTCEWVSWYVCYDLANCGPYGSGGSCAWGETPEFIQCMKDLGGPISDTCLSSGDCPQGQFCDLECAGGACFGTCADIGENPCVVSGCSGQICYTEPMMSTCEWLPWYACFSQSECGPFADGGTCSWKNTSEFEQCLLNNGGGGF